MSGEKSNKENALGMVWSDDDTLDVSANAAAIVYALLAVADAIEKSRCKVCGRPTGGCCTVKKPYPIIGPKS